VTLVVSSPSRRIGGGFRPGSACVCFSPGSSTPGKPRAWTSFDASATDVRSGLVTSCDADGSLSTGMDGAFTVTFRMTRLLTPVDLVPARVFTLARVAGLFAPLLLARFVLAGLALGRAILGLPRIARRTVRVAAFAVFPERGFFRFIPGSDPFGGCRILSDTLETTRPARAVQRESPLAAQFSVWTRWERRLRPPGSQASDSAGNVGRAPTPGGG